MNTVQKESCEAFELTNFHEQIMKQYKILSWLCIWQKQRHSLIKAFSWFWGFTSFFFYIQNWMMFEINAYMMGAAPPQKTP